MNTLVLAFSQAIKLVDGAVFPKNPLRIVLVPQKLGLDVSPNTPQFGFAQDTSDPSGQSDFYSIFENGFEDYLLATQVSSIEAQRLARRQNLAAKLAKDDIGLLEGMRYDQARTLLCLAVHEVRHRAQYQLEIPLIDKTHTDKVPRCRLWGHFQYEHYQNDPLGKVEFDAKLIEALAAFDWGIKDANDISPHYLHSLVRMTPEQFLAREVK